MTCEQKLAVALATLYAVSDLLQAWQDEPAPSGHRDIQTLNAVQDRVDATLIEIKEQTA